jgi:DNA-binding Lrp family transcriptional regulator
MAKACILIKTVPTSTEKILESIRRMNGVRKAYTVYGRWDVAVFLDAPIEKIGKLSATINSMDGVRSSETLPEA